jgi:hypothetical protein
MKLELAFGVTIRLNIALGVELWIQCIYNMCINMKRLTIRNVHECIYVMRALCYVLYLCTLYWRRGLLL